MTHTQLKVPRGSRLEFLLSMYDAKRADAAEAERVVKEFGELKDAIKFELTQLAGPALESSGNSVSIAFPPHLARPLKLQCVEGWRLDTYSLKQIDPQYYVKHAIRTYTWKLTQLGEGK